MCICEWRMSLKQVGIALLLQHLLQLTTGEDIRCTWYMCVTGYTCMCVCDVLKLAFAGPILQSHTHTPSHPRIHIMLVLAVASAVSMAVVDIVMLA